jgi:hypothetical protein
MKDAADYLAYIKALVIANPQVLRCVVLREEAQGGSGLVRLRVTWRDGSLLELFERFQVAAGSLQVTKYRFHWQEASGQLRKRWDNAAHHPEVPTHPNHLHDGSETNVLPHGSLSAADVLDRITSSLTH